MIRFVCQSLPFRRRRINFDEIDFQQFKETAIAVFYERPLEEFNEDADEDAAVRWTEEELQNISITYTVINDNRPIALDQEVDYNLMVEDMENLDTIILNNGPHLEDNNNNNNNNHNNNNNNNNINRNSVQRALDIALIKHGLDIPFKFDPADKDNNIHLFKLQVTAHCNRYNIGSKELLKLLLSPKYIKPPAYDLIQSYQLTLNNNVSPAEALNAIWSKLVEVYGGISQVEQFKNDLRDFKQGHHPLKGYFRGFNKINDKILLEVQMQMKMNYNILLLMVKY